MNPSVFVSFTLGKYLGSNFYLNNENYFFYRIGTRSRAKLYVPRDTQDTDTRPTIHVQMGKKFRANFWYLLLQYIGFAHSVHELI